MAAKKSVPGSKNTSRSSESGVLSQLKKLIHEGNIRRVVVTDKSGDQVLSLPLTIVILVTIILPALTVVGTIAALILDCSFSVNRRG